MEKVMLDESFMRISYKTRNILLELGARMPLSLLKSGMLAAVIIGSCVSARAQINAEQVMRVGQNALYFEDYMLSIQYFNQAIQAKPYLAQPYFMRAIAKLNLEDYLGAEEDATAAIERNPFIADAYEVRGVARQNRGKAQGAVEDYDNALKLVTKNRGLLFNKALAQQEMKQYDSARVSLNLLLTQFPNFENGYIGRARLNMLDGDTVAALKDIDHALSLNKNLPNGYLLRADIAMNGRKDYEAAKSDISEAIRLLPREAGLYVNRAFTRYHLDDYSGALADYDYAIQLDPLGAPAIYNRGLLRMEVRDNDNAIKDFTRALELDPNDYRSLYNRAVLYSEKKDIPHAMADVNKLIEAFPELPEALYMRSNLHRMAGQMGPAEKDYKQALKLARALPSPSPVMQQGPTTVDTDGTQSKDKKNKPSKADDREAEERLTPEAVARRFTALRTVENTVEVEEEYNNKNIRGRVQDRTRRIELEPLFTLSYYTSPTELRPTTYYLKEIDDVNSTRQLRFVVQLTNADIAPSADEMIAKHFRSVEYYNSYIATHTPRAIDYFGRAMDFMALRDYASALADLDRAIDNTPDFALAYFARGCARYRLMQAGTSAETTPRQVQVRAIISDFDKAIQLSPRMAFAYYNKGNILAEMGDYTSALMAFNAALDLKPDLGEAWYNRGYVYFQLGNRDKGVENLSKAGELGVVPSYNLIKRMN